MTVTSIKYELFFILMVFTNLIYVKVTQLALHIWCKILRASKKKKFHF